jgi:hypothetical protein
MTELNFLRFWDLRTKKLYVKLTPGCNPIEEIQSLKKYKLVTKSLREGDVNVDHESTAL